MEAVTGAPAAAQDSLAAALATAQQVGGDTGARIASAAQDAFVAGMHTGALVAAAITVAGAILAGLWLPAEAATPDRVPAEAAAA
jgi:DHA2 family multidrug resistance protein-like MFS transporter